eukprot:354865-Chlamydomonas_euryale.AAC.5
MASGAITSMGYRAGTATRAAAGPGPSTLAVRRIPQSRALALRGRGPALWCEPASVTSARGRGVWNRSLRAPPPGRNALNLPALRAPRATLPIGRLRAVPRLAPCVSGDGTAARLLCTHAPDATRAVAASACLRGAPFRCQPRPSLARL